ncbi:hypothetical protein [Kitasatospora sp. NPDC001683]
MAGGKWVRVTLSGAAAWWTPRLLDRVLPRIDAEGGGSGGRR